MIGIIDDTDLLMGYFEHFRLDTWINMARTYGNDMHEQDYMEMNARNLVTRWGPNAEITEYASREWNGLMTNYYKKRWQMFFDGKTLDELEEFEINWQYENIDDLELDNNYNQNKNDFSAFYQTLNDIYNKYRKFIDCKQKEQSINDKVNKHKQV